MPKKSKIVIIGGNSILAQYLLPPLKSKHDVITAGRKNCDLLLDVIEDNDSFHLPDGTETLIYAAAAFNSQENDDISDIYKTNVNGALKCCKLLKECSGKHFILISSIYTLLPYDHPYMGAYAQSKKQAEDKVSQYCRDNNLNLTILRPSPLYDARGLYRKHQGMIYRIADAAESGQEISIFGNHDAVRNYLHIDDMVQIILRCIERNVFGTWNCQFPADISISSIGKAAISAFQSSSQIKFYPEKPPIPDTLFQYDRALYDLIGYIPLVTIERGMQLISNYRKMTKE